MPLVNRSDLKPHHDAVLAAWRGIVQRSSTLRLADRIVIAMQLESRAKALAMHEGLANDSGDLAMDTRAFALSVKQQNPVASYLAAYGIGASVLGFFGLSFAEVLLQPDVLDTARTGTARVSAEVAGVFAVASASVIAMLLRGAFLAAHKRVRR